MRSRLARIAWTLVGVSVVGAVLDTWITAVDRSLMSEAAWARHGWPFATLATVGCSLMGALIVSRYPRHPIGWLLCITGLSSISLVTEAYSLWVLHGDGPGTDTAGHWTGWVALLFGAPLPITAVILVFLVAPAGRLLSPRWRWAARAAVTGLVFYTAGVLTIPPGGFDIADQDEDYGLLPSLLTSVGILLLAATLVSAAVSVALRLRRAEGEARRQLLWIAASATFLASGFVWLLAAQLFVGPEQTLLVALPLFAAYLAFPISTAVAVLRHRLFDIDLFVNRALVVALATGLVAVGYVALVVVLGSALGEGGPGGFWASLLATAVVAMAFQPLRRWVVRVADRLAFGNSAAPYEALADFSRRLGESPDPARLLSAVAGAAGRAVGASRASVRLPVPGGPDQVATWTDDSPHSSESEITVSVTDRGETLGTLCVEMPPGRALRDRDRELLQDLADQSAVAFRNARLSAELTQRVEQLGRRTSDLLSSTRRLITAGDAERSRLERAIARQVAPHLEPLPERLRELSREPERLRPPAVEPLVAAATFALEALREITRGVYPAQLTRSGLAPALGSLLGRDGLGHLVVDGAQAGRRLEPRVEAAAYFCVAEAVRDVDPPIEVVLTTTATEVRLVVSGGEGGSLALAAMRDRVEAAGGTVDVRYGPGETVLELVLPTWTGQPATPAQTASSRSGPNADLVT